MLNSAKDIDCLSNLGVETCKIIEVSLDLVNWKVDQHACNPGSALGSSECLYIGINELTDKLLQVRVAWYDYGEQLEPFLVVVSNFGIWMGKRALDSCHTCGVDDYLRLGHLLNRCRYRNSRLMLMPLSCSVRMLYSSSLLISAIIMALSLLSMLHSHHFGNYVLKKIHDFWFCHSCWIKRYITLLLSLIINEIVPVLSLVLLFFQSI
jgi:hypothetical protein